MPNKSSFDIVLPCHNPGIDWSDIVLEHFIQLKTIYRNEFKRLIIVNDGSQTVIDTSQLRKGISEFIWVDYPVNQGKGYALRQGVANSTSDFCFYTDLDFPFGIQPFHDAYQKLSNGTDVVMGLRNREYYDKLPFRRLIISNITNFMNRALLRIPFKDAQAGLKGFNKKGKELFLTTKINSFLFDSEFILLADRCKLKISTVPVVPRDQVRFSSMKMKVLLRELSNFIMLLRRK